MSDDSISSTVESWTDDIELILSNINYNCIILIHEHKLIYLYYHNCSRYFRIPIIILSSINSVLSVGLTSFISQILVSVICCLISLICACVSAIELFLQIHTNAETSLNAYRDYELLAVKISSLLKLERSNRDQHGITFLNIILNEYNKIFTSSLVVVNNIDDKLINLNKTKSQFFDPELRTL